MANETTEYLTTQEVCGKLAAAGVDEATVGRIFAARLEPRNLDDTTRKFSLGVPARDEQVFLVIFQFGKAVGDEIDHYTPQWLSVEGPFPIADAAEKAKELTSR